MILTTDLWQTSPAQSMTVSRSKLVNDKHYVISCKQYKRSGEYNPSLIAPGFFWHITWQLCLTEYKYVTVFHTRTHPFAQTRVSTKVFNFFPNLNAFSCWTTHKDNNRSNYRSDHLGRICELQIIANCKFGKYINHFNWSQFTKHVSCDASSSLMYR